MEEVITCCGCDFLIKDHVLIKCLNIKNHIVIPESVYDIGFGAFQNCKELESVVIQHSLVRIGTRAFCGCTNLKELILPETKAPIIINPNAFMDCFSLCDKDGFLIINNSIYFYDYRRRESELSIPDGVVSIEENAFWQNFQLYKVILPNSVKSIKSHAFTMCDNLESIILNDNLESIGFAAFSGCKNLSSIIIPKSVTTIAGEAFYACHKLHIYCKAENKPDGWNAQWNTDNNPVTWNY